MTTKKIITRQVPCDAVLLLMQRMDSHPEEFALNSSSKWHQLLDMTKRRVVDGNRDAFIILEDFECEMIWGKFKTAGKKTLHTFVMKQIFEEKENER